MVGGGEVVCDELGASCTDAARAQATRVKTHHTRTNLCKNRSITVTLFMFVANDGQVMGLHDTTFSVVSHVSVLQRGDVYSYD